MARTEEIKIRLSAEGKAAVISALRELGREGQKAAKSIEDGAKPASTALVAINAAAKEGSGAIECYARRLGPIDTAELRRWQVAEPLFWAEESMALRPVIYAFGREFTPSVLSQTYLNSVRTTLDRRLAQAGVRLAARLNAVFDCRTR